MLCESSTRRSFCDSKSIPHAGFWVHVAAGNCSTFALKLILQSNQVCKIKHVWALICFQYRLTFQTLLQWDPTALWISHLSTTHHSTPVPIDYFHIQTFQFDWSHQSEVDENGWSHTEINLSFSLVVRRGGAGAQRALHEQPNWCLANLQALVWLCVKNKDEDTADDEWWIPLVIPRRLGFPVFNFHCGM